MLSRFLRFVLFVAPLVVPDVALAKDKILELRWSELAPVLVGQTVAAKLPGGATFRGEALAVRDDSLVVDIRRTSDSKTLSSGQQSIPRASLPQIDLIRHKGVVGRVAGTIVGVLGGLVLSGY